MESRFKVAGHAVHPMLITVPVGMFVGTVAFDVVHLASGGAEPARVAFWMLATGLAGGVLAAVTGLVDWAAIPRRTRAKRIGLVHAGVNDVALVLFATSWFLRLAHDDHQPGVTALVLSFAGIGVAGLGAWLGGELVERLGVSVDDDAHVDAVSSLRRHGLITAHSDTHVDVAARLDAPSH